MITELLFYNQLIPKCCIKDSTWVACVEVSLNEVLSLDCRTDAEKSYLVVANVVRLLFEVIH